MRAGSGLQVNFKEEPSVLHDEINSSSGTAEAGNFRYKQHGCSLGCLNKLLLLFVGDRSHEDQLAIFHLFHAMQVFNCDGVVSNVFTANGGINLIDHWAV